MESFAPILIIAAFWIFIPLITSAKKKKAGQKSAPVRRSVPPRRDAGAGVSNTVYSSPREAVSGKLHGDDHTHDRLDFDCYKGGESQYEHYKKQLDSFMKAGLIERSEYNILLRRYTGR